MVYRLSSLLCLWIFHIILSDIEKLHWILVVGWLICWLIACRLAIEWNFWLLTHQIALILLWLIRLLIIWSTTWGWLSLRSLWGNMTFQIRSLLIFDYDFASFLFDLVEELLSMASNLGAWSSFYEILYFLPIFAEKTQS